MPSEVIKKLMDPAFHSRPLNERLAELRQDPGFASLDTKAQGEMLSEFDKEVRPVPTITAPERTNKGFLGHAKDFAKEAISGVGGALGGMVDTGKQFLSDTVDSGPIIAGFKGAQRLVEGAAQDMAGTVMSGIDEFGRMRGGDKNASGVSAAGKVVGGLIPFAGPMAVRAGEEMGSGNFGTGAAKGLGAVLAASPSLAKTTGRVTAGGVKGAAEGMMAPTTPITRWHEAPSAQLIGATIGGALGHKMGGWHAAIPTATMGALGAERLANAAKGAAAGVSRGFRASARDLAYSPRGLGGRPPVGPENASNRVRNSANTVSEYGPRSEYGPIPGQQYLEGGLKPTPFSGPMMDPRLAQQVIDLERVPQQMLPEAPELPALPEAPRVFEMPGVAKPQRPGPELGPNPVWEMPGKISRGKNFENLSLGPRQAAALDPEFSTFRERTPKPQEKPSVPVSSRVPDPVRSELRVESPTPKRQAPPAVSTPPRQPKSNTSSFRESGGGFDEAIAKKADEIASSPSRRRGGAAPAGDDLESLLSQSLDNAKQGKVSKPQVTETPKEYKGLGNTASNAKAKRIVDAILAGPNAKALPKLRQIPHDSPVWDEVFKQAKEKYPERWEIKDGARTSPTISKIVKYIDDYINGQKVPAPGKRKTDSTK